MKNILLNKGADGSLTIEAALVFPIFIFIIIAFTYFLQIIGLEENLQHAITETGFYTAKYAYVYETIKEYEKGEEKKKEEKKEENKVSNLKTSIEAAIAKSIDSTYYKIKMQDYLDKYKIDHSCIKNGVDGIHTYLSGFMKEDDAIDIILVYDIRLPLLFIAPKDFPVMQRVRMRGWNGHDVALKNSPPDSSESNEKMVYITETGTVYHLFKDCTYLDLSIHEVDIGQIEVLRNNSGGKYKKCSICGDSGVNAGGNKVYITNSGDRYHYDLNCSGLKRTIITIPISEVGNRGLCTRCNARDK